MSDGSNRSNRNKKKPKSAKKKKKGWHGNINRIESLFCYLYIKSGRMFENRQQSNVGGFALLSMIKVKAGLKAIKPHMFPHSCFLLQWRLRMATVMRQTIRTTARCASREERSFCVTPVPELITWSVWTLTWRRHLRASGAAHTV